jgi:hypothetical protein
MTSATNGNRVNASPEKRFFITMLVKDIELVPAIIDLVDNSVDAARSIRGNQAYDGLRIELTAGSEHFSIFDNCGGMEATLARDYAFRFGRPTDFEPVPSSVGQFGVGMKRALFKLGKRFAVESAAARSSFRLEVDVEAWAAVDEPDWSFTFSEVDFTEGVAEEDRFTRIDVSHLHSHVAADLGKSTVINRLRSQLALKHQSALQRGLRIVANGIEVESAAPALLASDQVRPINKSFSVPVDAAGELQVRIVAGLAATRRADHRDDGVAEDFTEVGEAGWYVYCNDRLVLEADRSGATGWGTAAAAYHPQYRQFRGYVFMNAEDSSLLPWNTTKTGLDRDAPAFRRVQAEMQAVLKEVQAVINRVKRESAYDRDADSDPTPLVQAVRTAAPTPIPSLPESTQVTVPPDTPQHPTPPSQINVQYRVPKAQMDKAMALLNETSASRVGRITFDYFVTAELEDE